MAYPTILEKYGSLSATGFAKEATFGTPVAATTFLPMISNTMEEDPGWFAPHLMQNLRDLQIYNLYGEAKFNGTIHGPIFPSNSMEVLVASIGADSVAGAGVVGTTPGSPVTTTLSAPAAVNDTTVTVTSATGLAMNDIIQIGVNGTGPVTTAECRMITNIATDVLTLDEPLNFAHATAAAVALVIAPFTHTIQEQNTLPSLTVEKNIGGFQSLQFAGCRVNKFDLKAPVGNTAVEMSMEMMGRSVAVLNSPTPVSVVDEMPFVFAEANLTIFDTLRTEVSNVGVSIENGVKETYTYSNFHGPSFLTPVTLHTSGQIDLVFDSLNDATYGDFQKMANGTLGSFDFTLAHPDGSSTITITMPQVVLNKYSNDLKMEDVVMSSLSYEASRPLSGANQYTIQATVSNSVYLPY